VQNIAKYNSIHIEHTQPANHTSPNGNHNSNIGDQYSFKCNQNLLNSCNLDVKQKRSAGQKKLTKYSTNYYKIIPKEA